MKKYLIFLLCLMTLGCTHTTNENTNTPTLKVAATIYPLAYFTQQIGGQYVNVTQLVEDDVDIHNYKITIQALNNAQSSDLILYIDPTLEPYVNDLLYIIDENSLSSVNILERVKEQTAPEIGQGQTLINGTLTVEESSDPNQTVPQNPNSRTTPSYSKQYNHLWLHPSYALIMCDIIKNDLTSLRPEYEAIFQANYDNLKEELLNLNRVFQTLTTASNKYFMTTHDAFSTWQSYGLIEIPILDYYENEPAQEDLQQLIEASITLNLRYLFYEPNLDSNLINQIQSDFNLEPIPLYNLATLTKEQVENDDDYFSIMYSNINNLKKEVY
ncbi:MAG: zinc ABC transporter substrate-binding protein [Turicibacter sp.]|nr:zinc ABC transporter substrate-binding protein [Turicibacter sp.]